MSRLLARWMPGASALAAAMWLVVAALSGYALATGRSSFEDVGAYLVGGVLAAAILLTTAVLVGACVRGVPDDEAATGGWGLQGFLASEVQVRENTTSPPRGPAILGIAAAVAALLFVWFVPVWAGLFIWAVASTVVRTRASGLSSSAMRIVLLSGLGLFALAIPVVGLVLYTPDAIGIAMWIALAVLALVMVAWHAELTVRAMRHPLPGPHRAGPPSPA